MNSKTSTRKRVIFALGFLLLLAASGAGFYVIRNSRTQYHWRAATVEQGDIRLLVNATGTLNAVTTVQVGTQVSGTIAKIMVDFNSSVKKNQVIAKLDTTALEESVHDAQAGVRKAEIGLVQAKRNQDRNDKLNQKGLIARADYDQSETDYENAKASLISAKAQLEKANTNLQYATITSPISGVVISRNVDVGQTVAASFNTPTLFTIAQDLTKMQLQASIDEGDIGQIRVGQSVEFTVDAYPGRKFYGKVQQIRLQPAVVQNVVNYTVIIEVPNHDQDLMPGMTANLNVLVKQQKDVLRVPTTALRFRPPIDYLQKKFAERRQNAPSGNRAGQGQRQGFGTGGGGNRPPGSGNFGQANQEIDLSPGAQARLWVIEGTDIKPVKVTVGISDGSFTEIKEGDVKADQQIAIGYDTGSTATDQQRTPFGMQQQQRGFRRF